MESAWRAGWHQAAGNEVGYALRAMPCATSSQLNPAKQDEIQTSLDEIFSLLFPSLTIILVLVQDAFSMSIVEKLNLSEVRAISILPLISSILYSTLPSSAFFSKEAKSALPNAEYYATNITTERAKMSKVGYPIFRASGSDAA